MIVEFKMVIDDYTIEFKSIGKKEDNVLTFKDMNNKDNTITVYILEEQIIVLQNGVTQMENTYTLNKKVEGFYKGLHNINGVTHCDTKVLNINENEIYIEYDYYFNNNFASNNTLLIKY